MESREIPRRELIAFFDALLTQSTTDDGVWKLPDGDAYYAYRLRSATTTRMSPQEVHGLGLSEVARIETEMMAILAMQAQLRSGETPAQALSRLAKDPRFLYSNTDDGRKAALADYTRMIEDQLARSRAVIGLVPKAPIEVKRVPQFKETTAPGAYYFPPALDGTRPGVFYANLRDTRYPSSACARSPCTRACQAITSRSHWRRSRRAGRPSGRCYRSPPTARDGPSMPSGWAPNWASTRTTPSETWAGCRPRCFARCAWSSTPASITSAGPASGHRLYAGEDWHARGRSGHGD